MEENKSPATSCKMPESVNYRGKWRDDRFHAPEAPVHTPGNDSAITWSIIFASTNALTQGGN